MSQSSNFPDVREFRTRLRSMGFSTGADKMLPPSSRPQKINARQKTRTGGGRGVLGLWGVLGAGAASVLAWLMVDLGGPSQLVTALYSVETRSSDWAALRRDIRRLASERPDGVPEQGEEVIALRRRIAMLEGKLARGPAVIAASEITGPGGAPASPMGAPRTTASLPAAKPATPIAERFAPLKEKIDFPPAAVKGATRPPTHISSQNGPKKMALATNSAKRSRLAPDTVFGLDLGGYKSIEDLARRWKLIQGKNGDVLGDLVPRRVTEISADGRVVHRLIAAPLADVADVARRCASLQARLVPCRQTIGAGEPL